MGISQGMFKISTRVFSGFGVMIVLLGGLVFYVNDALDKGAVRENEYIRRTKQAQGFLEAKASLIETRRAVTLFLLQGGQITAIDAALTQLKEQFVHARDSFKRQERKDRVTKAMDALVDYRKGLDVLVKVREDKDEAAKALETLRAAGQAIQDQIVALTDDINKDLNRSQTEMDEVSAENKEHVRLIGIIAVLLGLGIAYIIGRGITVPIRKMTAVMGLLAEGNLKVEIPSRENKDEVGQMAKAVEVFKENAIKVEAMRVEQAQAEERAAAQRKEAMLLMAQRFEDSVMGVVKNVSSQAAEM